MKQTFQLLIFISLCLIFTPALSGQAPRNLEQDLQFFESQLQQYPESPDLNYNMAQVYFLMGNMDQAIRFLERTIYLADDDSEAMLKLASIYRKIGKLADARNLLKRAADISPKNFEIWYELAIAYSDLANSAAALDAFQKALQYSSNQKQTDMVIYYMGLLHLSNRDYERFKYHLDRLKKSGEYYEPLKKLGQLWKPDLD
jgi:tetratricopeptide (TPR) repeat protein